ncbi:hypothetical protein GGS23DRAFT_83622 [Durotheca rogersii]|uniref:uncharacterized protein n=1 Tax=Durotheca rogersii TaxID=419775 RepID=UPI00221EDB22|nr:uncharacterized protein GGS23DRAFT_83622 [Durotheca rogersii]KAI5862591.1 hypothetical protein GGS23DRAFT_83622 [Durotheca rogersii]
MPLGTVCTYAVADVLNIRAEIMCAYTPLKPVSTRQYQTGLGDAGGGGEEGPSTYLRRPAGGEGEVLRRRKGEASRSSKYPKVAVFSCYADRIIISGTCDSRLISVSIPRARNLIKQPWAMTELSLRYFIASAPLPPCIVSQHPMYLHARTYAHVASIRYVSYLSCRRPPNTTWLPSLPTCLPLLRPTHMSIPATERRQSVGREREGKKCGWVGGKGKKREGKGAGHSRNRSVCPTLPRTGRSVDRGLVPDGASEGWWTASPPIESVHDLGGDPAVGTLSLSFLLPSLLRQGRVP